MANLFQVKRTTVSGRTPNTSDPANTQYIDTGELALNLTDGKMFSSNGTVQFEVGANLTNQNVSNTANAASHTVGSNFIANSTAIIGTGYANISTSVNSALLTVGTSFIVNTTALVVTTPLTANGSTGTAGQFLISNGSTGAPYWAGGGGNGTVTQVDTGNGLTGGPITSTGTISVNANTGLIANSSGLFVDAIYASALSVNNASYVGGNSAADLRLYSSNANNITSGTLDTARLPSTANITTAINVGANINISTTNISVGNSTVNSVVNSTSVVVTTILANSINATSFTTTAFIANATSITPASNTYSLGSLSNRWNLFANTGDFSGAVTIGGNLTVSGNTFTVSARTLAVTDHMIFMNNGVLANITGATGNGTAVVFVANNNYANNWDVTVTGVTPSSFNGTYHNITQANATHFIVANTNTDTYTSGGTARGTTDANPDIGFAAGYNDGTYHHTGFFRDATDGVYKVFDNYDPEPDDSAFIDTSNATFRIANLQANGFLAAVVNATTSVNSATISSGTSFIANSTQVTLNNVPLSANGTTGTAGQVLASNGATGAPYWSTASGGSGSGPVYFSSTTITSNVNVTTGNNAMIIGPVNFANGVGVSVANNSRLVIL